jgi:intein-encoded DNA endonuclease-like protein
MSDKAFGAENQQATLAFLSRESSETIRQTPFTKPKIIVYLNGALHDATLNKGKRIRFSQKNRQWLKNLQFLLKKVNCNSWIYKEGKTRNIYVLETLCKDLDFNFNPLELDTFEKKSFYIRGFFDAEGGIPHKKGRFYIQLVQKNLEKI